MSEQKEQIKKLNRTMFNAEKDTLTHNQREIYLSSRKETDNSINRLLLSFEQIMENISAGELLQNIEHIDSVYYNIGKIKGLNK